MLDYYRFRQVLDLFDEGKAQEARAVLKELQEKYIEVCDENDFLKTQVEEYEDILYLAKNLEFDGTSYWLMTGAVRQGPFCRNCYNQNGLLIRLQEHGNQLKCFTCGETHITLEEEAESQQQAQTAHSNKVIPLYK